MDSLPFNVLFSYYCEEYWNLQKITLLNYKNLKKWLDYETSFRERILSIIWIFGLHMSKHSFEKENISTAFGKVVSSANN